MPSAPEFTPWPKIARLNRDIVITEKIDGTNGAIGVTMLDEDQVDFYAEQAGVSIPAMYVRVAELGPVLVYAQSRSRIITPQQDNHGFACWVYDNAAMLAATLGPGLHFGEWWGSGIQRGYGLQKGEKRFSLFNTKRWGDIVFMRPHELRVVPILYEGPYRQSAIGAALAELALYGSQAAPRFDQPEGIVVYHTAARSMFKVTIEGDEAPKTLAA